LNGMKEVAKKHTIEISEDQWVKDKDFAKATLKGELATVLFNDRNLYHLVRIQADTQVQTALNLFDEAQQLAEGHLPVGGQR